MLLLTNEKIEPTAGGETQPHQPFQPGEVFIVKYMTTPAVVTILKRTGEAVTTWAGTWPVEVFNERVVVRIGRRRRVLGFWLPWISFRPERVIHAELKDSVGTDESFWRGYAQ
jgi:hypothetical protein